MSEPWVPAADGPPPPPQPSQQPDAPHEERGPREPHPPTLVAAVDPAPAPAAAGRAPAPEPTAAAWAPAAAAPAVPGGVAASSSGPFDPEGVVWQGVSPRLITVRLISAAVGLALPLAGTVAAAVLAPVPALWVLPAAVVALGVLIAVIVPRQVRALGYAERDDDLLIRKGVLLRSLVVVPYGRMQFVDVQAGPLDRWGGVARVQLHTASPGSDAAIPGLPPAEAARMRDRLAARGEAQLAGL